MKLDLQKAYDKVNWKFLRVVLLNFGFHESFVNLILQCVSSMSFFFLFNGGKSAYFHPTRELKQGDPLSPYLFILCQEVLARLIDREHAARSISGVKMNIGGP